MAEHFKPNENQEPLVITEEIDNLLNEIDGLLADGRFQSEEEKNFYLRKLHAFLLISNNAQVREMINYIEAEYKDD
ncbi:hypothetical protein H6784_05830 [Candidatus Nomurabacteria bacterium]|nr:hypothetical protein [Candidatus Nomurabacteria bacterium]